MLHHTRISIGSDDVTMLRLQAMMSRCCGCNFSFSVHSA